MYVIANCVRISHTRFAALIRYRMCAIIITNVCFMNQMECTPTLPHRNFCQLGSIMLCCVLNFYVFVSYLQSVFLVRKLNNLALQKNCE
jgi:hypothetical protein